MRKGSPCLGHTPPRAVRTRWREARRPRQACQTPCGTRQGAHPPPPCMGWRVARARCPSPAGSPPLQAGAWCRPSAGHAMPSYSPRGRRRGVTGAVAAARCPASLPRGTGVSPSMAGGRSGAAGGCRRVAVRPRAKPGGPGVGLLPGCGAHSAQTPSLCAGPGQAGRRGAIQRAACRAHAAPNHALEPTPTASARASLRLLARLTAGVIATRGREFYC